MSVRSFGARFGLLAVALGSVGLAPLYANPQVFLFPNLNQPIPDNNPAGISSTQFISSSINSISDVNVLLRIEGPWNGDLYATLRHRNGTAILLNRVGRSAAFPLGYGDRGFDIRLDDAAPGGDVHVYRVELNGSELVGVPAPPPPPALTGSWQPSGRDVNPETVLNSSPRTRLLNEFVGQTANGVWELEVQDFSGGDPHRLLEWGLEFRNAQGQTQTITFANLNLPVPDGTPVGLIDLQTVANATIGTISDLNVYVKIAGTWNGDLAVTLSKGEKYAVLLNRVGRRTTSLAGYNDDGFNVVFDDQAANGDVHNYRVALNGSHSIALPVQPSPPAVTGDWAPDGRAVDPLTVDTANARTALLSAFNGMDANGEWTLTVSDLGPGDSHRLVGWGLEISGASTPVNYTSTVVLSDWVGAGFPQVYVRVGNGAEQLVTITPQSATTGAFTLSLNPGSYDIRVRPVGFLAQKLSINTSVPATFNGPQGTGLLGGDSDGDGAVDDADLTNLILDFGGPGGGAGATDFNGDGVVDDGDLTILILNFGGVGDN